MNNSSETITFFCEFRNHVSIYIDDILHNEDLREEQYHKFFSRIWKLLQKINPTARSMYVSLIGTYYFERMLFNTPTKISVKHFCELGLINQNRVLNLGHDKDNSISTFAFNFIKQEFRGTKWLGKNMYSKAMFTCPNSAYCFTQSRDITRFAKYDSYVVDLELRKNVTRVHRLTDISAIALLDTEQYKKLSNTELESLIHVLQFRKIYFQCTQLDCLRMFNTSLERLPAFLDTGLVFTQIYLQKNLDQFTKIKTFFINADNYKGLYRNVCIMCYLGVYNNQCLIKARNEMIDELIIKNEFCYVCTALAGGDFMCRLSEWNNTINAHFCDA